MTNVILIALAVIFGILCLLLLGFIISYLITKFLDEQDRLEEEAYNKSKSPFAHY
jgi:uncharacterized membrane protein YraQ (UPF0718 family)